MWSELTRIELPTIEQQVDSMVEARSPPTAGATYNNSGTYEIIWERESHGDENDDFKPIAPDGVVKFFGRVNDGMPAPGGDDVNGFGPFKDIGSNIVLDEDVISGEPNSPPVMTLNISVPDAPGAAVQIQVIYYETSGIEFILGGEPCVDDPHLDPMKPSRVRDKRPARATRLRQKITIRVRPPRRVRRRRGRRQEAPRIAGDRPIHRCIPRFIAIDRCRRQRWRH